MKSDCVTAQLKTFNGALPIQSKSLKCPKVFYVLVHIYLSSFIPCPTFDSKILMYLEIPEYILFLAWALAHAVLTSGNPFSTAALAPGAWPQVVWLILTTT